MKVNSRKFNGTEKYSVFFSGFTFEVRKMTGENDFTFTIYRGRHGFTAGFNKKSHVMTYMAEFKKLVKLSWRTPGFVEATFKDYSGTKYYNSLVIDKGNWEEKNAEKFIEFFKEFGIEVEGPKNI